MIKGIDGRKCAKRVFPGACVHVPPAQVAEFEEEMRKAGADWQVIAYGNTMHSFTNPDAGKTVKLDGIAYNAQTDKRSWVAMRSFFDELFA